MTSEAPRPTALIIDDDRDYIEILSRVLENYGFATFSADSGPKGLEMMTQETYDVVLCDWMMPGLDGCQICVKSKELPNPPKVFVILSAYTDARGRPNCKCSFDWLRKPTTSAEVTTLLLMLKGRQVVPGQSL